MKHQLEHLRSRRPTAGGPLGGTRRNTSLLEKCCKAEEARQACRAALVCTPAEGRIPKLRSKQVLHSWSIKDKRVFSPTRQGQITEQGRGVRRLAQPSRSQGSLDRLLTAAAMFQTKPATCWYFGTAHQMTFGQATANPTACAERMLPTLCRSKLARWMVRITGSWLGAEHA